MLRLRTQSVQTSCTLYFFVFSSVYTKIAIGLLFASFLLQPVSYAYGSDSVDDEEEVSQEETAEVVEIETEEPTEKSEETVIDEESEEQKNETVIEEVVRTTDTERRLLDDVGSPEGEEKTNVTTVANAIKGSEDQVLPELLQSEESEMPASTTESTDVTVEVDQEVATTTVEDTAEEDVVKSATTTSPSEDESTATTSVEADGDTYQSDSHDEANDGQTDIESSEGDNASEIDGASEFEEAPDLVETATSTDVVLEHESATSTIKELKTESVATSTASKTNPEVQLHTISTVINDENRHQFSVDECMSVGGGSFYCTEGTPEQEHIEDGVFAVPDSDGDLEIMVRVNGVEQFLTDNQVDDSAPYFDALSERIVWHTLKQDRYQVVSYDFNTQETTFLTNSSYNNMEPVAYEDVTLWQAWIGNNWEIMLHTNGSTTQLTHNEVHDVAPHMRGGYVMWQTQFADGWQVAMYDLTTEEITYIGEGDGSRVENPRFVLVYDSLDENGDIKTIGFDLDSKESIPLSAIPTELPDKIPDSDQTGETRALIQSKPSPKTEVETDSDDINSPATTTATTSSTPAATSTDIVIPSVATELGDSVVATNTPEMSLDDIDMTQSTTSTEIASSTEHIPDLIIPPVASSSDAQSG